MIALAASAARWACTRFQQAADFPPCRIFRRRHQKVSPRVDADGTKKLTVNVSGQNGAWRNGERIEQDVEVLLWSPSSLPFKVAFASGEAAFSSTGGVRG